MLAEWCNEASMVPHTEWPNIYGQIVLEPLLDAGLTRFTAPGQDEELFKATLSRTDYSRLKNTASLTVSIPRPGLAHNLGASVIGVAAGIASTMSDDDLRLFRKAWGMWCVGVEQIGPPSRFSAHQRRLFELSLSIIEALPFSDQVKRHKANLQNPNN